MRNYVKYRSTVIDLLQSFLAGKIDKKELISQLYKIEIELGNVNTKKDLWFEFFENDTLCTTIANIDIDDRGENYYRECMQLSIDNTKELKIYFS